MTKPCRGPNAPIPPSFVLPRGACDSHLHVVGPYNQYPLSPQRAYTAPEAPLPMLREFMAKTGIDRVVIAHVSACGTDMRVTLDAMAALGDQARGTAMLTADATQTDIERLHEAGMRGIRLSDAFGYSVTADTLRSVADRIARFGWHIAIWPTHVSELKIIASLIDALPTRVVLDHLAARCWDPRLGIEQPDFGILRDLLRTGRVWLKLSGMYRASPNGFRWSELIPFGKALVQEFPDRLLWASDWPHVGHWQGPMPESGELLDWLQEIGCDEATRRQILVHNPEELYGF